jgi:GTP-binding protein EngB required for normal cell division
MKPLSQAALCCLVAFSLLTAESNHPSELLLHPCPLHATCVGVWWFDNVGIMNRGKIAILGDAGVGKSSLIVQVII